MLLSVARFKYKINLPSHLDFKLKSIISNQNQKLLKRFNMYRCSYKPILELYYPVKGNVSESTEILNNGFKITNWYSDNNNSGILLHNSPKAIISNIPHRVLICHVIADDFNVKRFKSEFGSDYLIANTNIIYPKYLLEFDILVNSNYSSNSKWFNFKYHDIKMLGNQEHPFLLMDDIIKIDY
jgi:hypothetical protein